jgi:predicted site-specific integrase-resolvase
MGQRSRPVKRPAVVFLRVSPQAQHPDLRNQRERLEGFCAAVGIAVDWFGSGLIEHLAAKHACEVLVLNNETLSSEREELEELMTIPTGPRHVSPGCATHASA